MGLDFDPTKYGMKDYAAEFAKKADEYKAYNRGRMDALGITVPIGKTDKAPVTPKNETVADEVRSDLGVTLTGAAQEADKAETADGAGAVAKADEVVEEQPVQGEVKTEETPKQPAKVEPLKEEQVQEQIMFGDEGEVLTKPRTLTSKQARKDAVADMTKQYLENGLADGTPVTDEKQARKMAEEYVKNEQNLEGFYSTKTYLTKEDYKAAQKANKQAKKDYYDNLRAQGMGRREARKKANEWAEQNLVHNERLKNKDALAYVQAHPEQFYDEDGNFSQVKYKQFTEGLMNTHTQEGEVRNGHLSLKERREAAETLHIDDDAVADMVHRAGGNFEKDYTEVKQIAIIGGATAAVATVGALLVPGLAVGAGAAAGAGAAGAGAGATGAAAAAATVEGLGALSGVPVAVGGTWFKDLFKDKGGTEPRVYGPGKKEEPPVPPNEEPHEEPQVCELTPDEFHQVVKQEVDYCSHTVQRGDNWSKVAQTKYRVQTGTDADGNPITRAVTPEEALKIAHELKMAHGIARKDFNKCIFPSVGKELKLYSEFDGLYHPELAGVKFIVDCDAQTDGKLQKGPMKGKYQEWNGTYNGAQRDYNIDAYWYTDCNNNRSNIFTNQKDRDTAMARRQAELNAAAGRK